MPSERPALRWTAILALALFACVGVPESPAGFVAIESDGFT